jgi:hypothetical protein
MTVTIIESLGFALTGQWLSGLADLEPQDADGILNRLDKAGWPSSRIVEFRAQTHAAGRRWPLAVPDDQRGDWGLAQFQAALVAILESLDQSQAQVRRATTLTADDRRLLAEVPPHHVA